VSAAEPPRRPLAVKFLHLAIVPANAYHHTQFQLSSSISFGNMRGVQTPPSGQFLHREIVRVNAYKCAKFQVFISISYGDIKEVPE